MQAIDITIHPNKVSKLMLIIILILTFLHISQLCLYFYINDPNTFDFIQLVDFDYEGNLPSFYSAIAILFSSLLLSIIALSEKRTNKKYYSHWIGLTFIFIFLALDEATAIHEVIGDLVENTGFIDAEGFLFFAWVVPYSFLVVIFIISYLRFLIQLPKIIRWRLILSGMIFITGAAGLEIISANEADLNGTTTIKYSVLYTVEELLEMLAIVLFCHTLMKYLQEQTLSLNLTMSSPK